MQTMSVWAYEVENNDWVNTPDGSKYVYSIDDTGDLLAFDLVDEEGDHELREYGAFEPVTIVTSFSDEDSIDDEDIFIDI